MTNDEELQRIRSELPEQMPECGCDNCSVCVRQAAVKRYGGDFRGGTVPWDSTETNVIAIRDDEFGKK